MESKLFKKLLLFVIIALALQCPSTALADQSMITTDMPSYNPWETVHISINETANVTAHVIDPWNSLTELILSPYENGYLTEYSPQQGVVLGTYTILVSGESISETSEFDIRALSINTDIEQQYPVGDILLSGNITDASTQMPVNASVNITVENLTISTYALDGMFSATYLSNSTGQKIVNITAIDVENITVTITTGFEVYAPAVENLTAGTSQPLETITKPTVTSSVELSGINPIDIEPIDIDPIPISKTLYISPTSNIGTCTDPTNAYANDGNYSVFNGAWNIYSGYNFNIPDNANIIAVNVRIYAMSSYPPGGSPDSIKLQLSCDGGNTWLTQTYSQELTGTQATYFTNVASWTQWTPEKINDDNIQIKVEDIGDNTVNLDWIPISVTYTLETNVAPDTTPPASVTGLADTLVKSTSINWTWTKPNDPDFNYTMVYINNEFMENVTGTSYAATELTTSTSYTIGTRTVDTSKNINTTWVNDTVTTTPYILVKKDETGDYTTIQAAVNAATAGDTILVYPGTYNENVDVNKQLNITSTGGTAATNVTAASASDHVFYITADGVTIRGFNVSGATNYAKSGIWLDTSSDNNTLTGNTASNNNLGILLLSSSNNTLTGNKVANNNYGFYMFSSSNNTLISNTALSNKYGSYLLSSSNNTLISNTALNNTQYGIWLDTSSDNNTLTGNTVANNTNFSIWLDTSSDNNLTNNTVANNTNFSIWLDTSSDNNLTNNTVANNTHGIVMNSSSNNTLTGNTASNNNNFGIAMSSSNNNLIYNNHFNNSVNTYFVGSNTGNVWNTTKTVGTNVAGGSYLGGNYWLTPDGTGFSQINNSDVNGDCICDETYTIATPDYYDYLPLAAPYTTPPANHAPTLSILSNNRKYIAPSEEWNKTFGGISSDYAYSLKQTSDEGYIIAGDTGSFGEGYHNAWLIKTDLNGTEEWNNTFGNTGNDYAYSVQQTNDDGYIIAGKTSSFGTGSPEAWLIKTDSGGIEEWNQTFGNNIDDYARSVQQTSDGGYIFAGRTHIFESGQVIDYAWLVKTDENGSHEWNKTFGGTSSDYAYSVTLTGDGGYIIAGETSSFGQSSYDAWLIKTDSSGAEQWNSTFDGIDGTYSDKAYSVKQVSDGGYIVAGEKGISYSSSNIWLIKTDSNGDQTWNRTFGNSMPGKICDIRTMKDSGYIVAGNIESPAGSNKYDGWGLKTDSEGNELWNKTIGGTGNDYIHSVTLTDEEEFIFMGNTESPAGSNIYDEWMIKLETEPLLIGINESELLTITLNATDPDENSISYSTNATFGTLTDNVFTWTPGPDDSGIYHVEFTASDGQLEDTETVTITVNDIPDFMNFSITKTIEPGATSNSYSVTLNLTSLVDFNKTDARAYDLIPTNFTITDPVPNYNNSQDNMFYWSLDLVAGESKVINYTLVGNGKYSLTDAFTVGIDTV